MEERKGEVTVQGNPVTLIGPKLEIGQTAPDFSLIDNDMKPITRAQFKGKILVLLSVPSLDTPVCDLEVRKFNKEAANLGEDVTVLVVSMDLPFAQKRWCGAAGCRAGDNRFRPSGCLFWQSVRGADKRVTASCPGSFCC